MTIKTFITQVQLEEKFIIVDKKGLKTLTHSQIKHRFGENKAKIVGKIKNPNQSDKKVNFTLKEKYLRQGAIPRIFIDPKKALTYYFKLVTS